MSEPTSVWADAWAEIEALVEDPDEVSYFWTLVDREFRQVDRKTVDRLDRRFGSGIGSEGLLLLGYLGTLDAEERGDLITRAKASPEATRLVSRFASTYSAELTYAFDLWSDDGDDWRSITRQVWRDVETGDVTLKLDILKNNREECLFRVSPGSLVRLIANFYSALTVVEDPSQFQDRDLDRLRTAAATFHESIERSADGPVSEVKGSTEQSHD